MYDLWARNVKCKCRSRRTYNRCKKLMQNKFSVASAQTTFLLVIFLNMIK